MTDFQMFMKAYEELCLEHGYFIAPSGYDSLQVWPIAKATRDHTTPFEMEDCTGNPG